MRNKGAVPMAVYIMGFIALIGVIALGGYWMWTSLAIVPTVEYTGEFDDAFLASKGNFANSFSQGTDCNVTSDILGGNWENCIFESRIALNATAEATMSDKVLTLSLAFDIDDNVGPNTEIDIDTGAGTSSTGVPADDVPLISVKLYTHDDNPQLVLDMSGGIDDQEDLDSYKTGVLLGGEYVVQATWHTGTISPDFTDGDDIARLVFKLDTTGDADKAQITIESA